MLQSFAVYKNRNLEFLFTFSTVLIQRMIRTKGPLRVKKISLKQVSYDTLRRFYLLKSPGRLVTSFFSVSLMALISILPVQVLDAHLTLYGSASINDLVLKQSTLIDLTKGTKLL